MVDREELLALAKKVRLPSAPIAVDHAGVESQHVLQTVAQPQR
jgi:hypothetical protein